MSVSLLALCYRVSKHKSYYGFYGPIQKIQNRSFFFVFINLSVHHIVTQSFPPFQPLLIVGRTQLKKKIKRTSVVAQW